MRAMIIVLISMMAVGCLPEGTTTQVDLVSESEPSERSPEIDEVVDDPPPIIPVVYMNKTEIIFEALESVTILIETKPTCNDPCPYMSGWQENEIVATTYNLDSLNNKIVLDVRKPMMIHIRKLQGDLDLIFEVKVRDNFLTSFNFDLPAQPDQIGINVLNVFAGNPEFIF